MARPQPVTATVTKPNWMKYQETTVQRSLSFDSSSGSTDSLLSVLDHDSYVESDNEMQEPASSKSPTDKQQAVQNSTFEDYTQSFCSNEETETIEKSQIGESFIDNSCSHLSRDSMSPWEKWLIEKEKKKREQTQKERDKRILERVQHIDKELQKQQKKIKESENTYRWIQEKNLNEKLRIRCEKERLKAAMQEEASRKNELNEKAKKKFDEWLQKKNEQHRLAKRAEVESRKGEEEKRRQKQALAEQKYNEWYKQVKTKVKQSNNSKGYLSGKLTDYHDRSAYPPPGFCNPIPWRPLSVPNPKMTEKKQKPLKCSTKKK